MAMNLSILYRGPLSSCNYECDYCPFAKRHETTSELWGDRRALGRFIDWIELRADDQFSILFTPWGEALVRSWYRSGVQRLSRLPNIKKVAIQTNLSCNFDWIADCDRSRLALWTTYHPREVDRAKFVSKCRQLTKLGVAYSVGVVGLREHFEEIEALRKVLPTDVYMWINAYKRTLDYYDPLSVEFLERLDPLFPINLPRYESHGLACRTGESVISVDGDGTIRRCHFVPEILGNIYESRLSDILKPRPCPATTCSCHIGYVHLDKLKLDDVFGAGVLERIPNKTPTYRTDESSSLSSF
jgi:MoaA/NifB/PqqE/SkfB family radical SAM enzyme